MTDEEMREWEDHALATTARADVPRPPEGTLSLMDIGVWRIADALLDLIERVRKAEAKVQAIEGSTLGQALRDAERKGAEEMRRKCYEAACDVAGEAIDKRYTGAASGAGEAARRIDRLALPGDAP